MCRIDLPFAVIYLLAFICLSRPAATQQPSNSDAPLSPDQISQLQAKAQAGDPGAQISLGKAYEAGSGVAQSDAQAVRWYRAAADQGNAEAQDCLGFMYRLGRGVAEDKSEAVRWYKKAAKQKNAAAMFNLGTAYYNGDGVGIDDVAASAWFLLAQSSGSQPANDAVKRMDAEARTLQAEALEKIGDMYEKGDDLPQSYPDAAAWYRKAAEHGAEPVGLVKLASLLMQGRSGPLDYTEVYGLCEKAAKLGYAPGSYCVGVLYHQGFGVERDPSRAAKWFLESAGEGYALATLRLGEMYWKGDGVKQDNVSAYEFISLASTSDLPDAQRDKERLEKELTPKEIQKGKLKAIQWAREHQPLVLKGKPPSAN